MWSALIKERSFQIQPHILTRASCLDFGIDDMYCRRNSCQNRTSSWMRPSLPCTGIINQSHAPFMDILFCSNGWRCASSLSVLFSHLASHISDTAICMAIVSQNQSASSSSPTGPRTTLILPSVRIIGRIAIAISRIVNVTLGDSCRCAP